MEMGLLQRIRQKQLLNPWVRAVTHVEQMRRLKKIAYKENCSFIPKEPVKPYFAPHIEQYIRTTAHEHLPKNQFEKSSGELQPENWVEIGGIVTYGGTLEEVIFSNIQQNTLVERNGVPGVQLHIPNMRFPDPDIEGVVLWHTHPLPDVSMTVGDLFVMQEFVSSVASTPYAVIYAPSIDVCQWYGFERR